MKTKFEEHDKIKKSVYLTLDLADLIKTKAKELRMSEAEVIRQVLEQGTKAFAFAEKDKAVKELLRKKDKMTAKNMEYDVEYYIPVVNAINTSDGVVWNYYWAKDTVIEHIKKNIMPKLKGFGLHVDNTKDDTGSNPGEITQEWQERRPGGNYSTNCIMQNALVGYKRVTCYVEDEKTAYKTLKSKPILPCALHITYSQDHYKRDTGEILYKIQKMWDELLLVQYKEKHKDFWGN